MKLILIEDVTGLGLRGESVEVKDGYANNFLIPKGLAVKSTKGKAREAGQLAREKMAKADRELKRAEESAQEISGRTFEVTAKTGEEGRLFGTITAKDIAVLLEKELKMQVDRKKIHLDEHIKSAGFHEARIKLHPQVEAIIHLKVLPE
ncbi:MAG: 50S ribosomal protein L9 [Actinobacteria bacterium RBG_19FT_COMBO_54_7]|uniref:Large ribosomal subunit protein bL9 n=1 Tax=Candidatus Solincola sediminis TaxID=1797199 RepID=A0A1F2WR82_9ACTN|nr:MAG: 50S ribosomal protein L9 [Candidatus Solincola sediminis]OFW61115.1 MAG: 50S ribosomal protein L9 [Candidatus Solincola sediminis]OFW67198.1 MAG: 50S ribosomal protein L9 [Actinobacteria bacterium RBG_19FT_COMBO_54_7]